MSSKIKCRFCGSKNIWKAGYTEGKNKKQRYYCKNCNKGFRVDKERKNICYIKCMICDQNLIRMTTNHLKLHNLNMRQYKKKFPGAEVSSILFKRGISIGISRYFSNPLNRDKMSKKMLDWFKNNPDKAEEIKRKIRKSCQTNEHRRIMSNSQKSWIKNHHEKWKGQLKKMVKNSKTLEIRQESSKRLKRIRNSKVWNKIEERRIRSLRTDKFRRLRSQYMIDYFEEHPEAKKKQSKKMVKWIENHPEEWEIIKKRSANTRRELKFRKKISKIVKGYLENHPEVGKGHSRRMKKLFKDQKWVKEWAKRRGIKPNKPEKILIRLLKEKNLPYKYVGNFKLMIGNKNPDFVNFDKKKLIELFGHFWHSERVENVDKHVKGRKDYFKKHGFDTLIVWDNELNDPERVVDKIIKFDKI